MVFVFPIQTEVSRDTSFFRQLFRKRPREVGRASLRGDANRGRALGQRHITVVTGGHGGVGMEAPCRGAYEVGGEPSATPLPNRAPNAYLTTTYQVDLLYPQVSFECLWAVRLGLLLGSDGFIAAGWDSDQASGGSLGTATELMAAFTLNAKLWKLSKRLAILHPPDVQIPGWDVGMLDAFMEWGILPREVRPSVHVARSPIEAVAWVTG